MGLHIQLTITKGTSIRFLQQRTATQSDWLSSVLNTSPDKDVDADSAQEVEISITDCSRT